MPLRAFHDPRAFLHRVPRSHPERPERRAAVLAAVDEAGWEVGTPDDAGWVVDSPQLIDAIEAVHDPTYVRRLREACERGDGSIDTADCPIVRESWQAALAAAACALAAARWTLDGDGRRAFAAMRPPGHHAERDRAMGFCYFNNAAVAAHWLVTQGGLERIAIVDFDVHHGNGPQHLSEARGDVLYVSIHQHPATLYPGTGFERETGAKGTPGEGRTLNVPLWPGSGHDEVVRACESIVLPRLLDHQPQAMVISAGFDADGRDPLGGLEWMPETFATITRQLVDVAERFSAGRIVSVLEGGYNPIALREGALAHLLAIEH